MASLPKVGKVIDSQTGRGIPNVAIIGAAHYDAEPLVHGSANEPLYRTLTRTDANGEYRTASTWWHTKIGVPGTRPTITWTIAAYKLGYAVDGDEAHLSADADATSRLPASLKNAPSATWIGGAVAIDPIQMHPVHLALSDAVIYYSRMSSIGPQAARRFQADEVALREEGYQMFAPQVCALDPEQRIPWGLGVDAFVYDKFRFIQQLDKLEPGVLKEVGERGKSAGFMAGNVCRAMHDAERSQ